MRKIQKILVANRGEIAIRVFRACHELGIKTVAIYSKEDMGALFRTKADEAYLVGKHKSPLQAYLDMDEIIKIAKKKGVDAIHPGYGFLSENPVFSKKCEDAGIIFIGPSAEMMNRVGDKIQSKIVANEVGVPTIPGVKQPIKTEEEAVKFAEYCGYPVMLKASAGGGGRGMRIVSTPDELIHQYQSARREAEKAFDSDDIFIEKYLESPRHIEVQILGDEHGNMVHLFERDCSIQRRHQKVIEYTPALNLPGDVRKALCDDAIKIGRAVNYKNAGTVEFLVDKNNKHYFIEMNPRIQVEHTVTEMVTGIDLVQSQIMIAEGHALDSEVLNIKQSNIEVRGYAIQCRITTEDPHNDFMPDTGQMNVYRTGSGFGIRLDGGNGFTGSIISPYYDSLLVKCTSWARTFEDAIRKSKRALNEITISGVKTNIGFLINVLNHDKFKNGLCDTNFIADNPAILNIESIEDHEYKLLKFLSEKVVNETKGQKPFFDVPEVPKVISPKELFGSKQLLDQKGPKGVVDWIHDQKKLLLTDTTMRDAQQSLMATRVRTRDMEKIAKATAVHGKDLFSVEMWGGATFDVAYRFLNESPWERLDLLRQKMPNVLLQMLIRGSNGVGYKNYPDNVIRRFIKESSNRGIDVYRIFDALNWLEGMKVAIDEVQQQDKIAEACICYTGDILDEYRDKYSLEYYVNLAKDIEKTGAHILGIKDMSALLKPYAAHKLIKTLKREVGMPIHLHTHDTTGNGVATVMLAAEAGVDIVDTAMNSMSGLTSQPALNSVVEALKHTSRDTGFDPNKLQAIDNYWQAVRPIYKEFESDLKSSTAEIYRYEIPGGQYSNLKPQVESFGLGSRFNEVKQMFKEVNDMLGDIVKVTPTSKAVGDLAIFMVQNNLTPDNILVEGKDLAYPDSIVSYFRGMMGQPQGGFPEALQKMIVKNEEIITTRPGELLPDEDFDKLRSDLETDDYQPTESDLLSAALYPKVYKTYRQKMIDEGSFRHMESDVFFHGLREGETCEVKIRSGKVVVIKLLEIGKLGEDGKRTLTYEVDGYRRVFDISEKNAQKKVAAEVEKADPSNPKDVGTSIPGNLVKLLVAEGDKIEKDQTLAIIEAMKMETVVTAKEAGQVDKVFVKAGDTLEKGQLLLKLN
ncbi:pyruvate carboxylase [Acidaminobacter sp. JC074]|uniref:pyruvate carboxylase n=1 Tax=Acidaminobacter sp. JC074 TaxID=2530199 RepID=UPI001F0D68AC|nr:pyruvate carboxylase [Acidaminobacter sp. JC074]MCH4890731.1 pyruvate carboxylase [Acidaminobacter sp. JC074]